MWGMKQGSRLVGSVVEAKSLAVDPPKLLVTLEPWHRVFFRNLRDLVWPRRRPPLKVSSRPASFWPDVFVASRLPWGRFLESAIFHTAAVMVLWSSAQLWPQRPQIVDPPVFHSSDVIYYEAPEYLAPINTGGRKTHAPQKGDPEQAAQPIISVPPEPDNRAQTIVTPPKLKLDRDVSLPNIVAWTQPTPTVPMSATVPSASDAKLPALPTAVVAPPPEVSRSQWNRAPALSEAVVAPAPGVDAVTTPRTVRAPQPAVVEPPPNVDTASTRKLGDINVGHAQVVAPAPQLPVSEQRAIVTLAQPGGSDSGTAVVPPAPSVQGTGISAADGRLIALNLHPAAATGPAEAPPGNRRGTFATTPAGKPGAAGTPDIPAGKDHTAGDNRGHGGSAAESGNRADGVPPGLFVGAGPKGGNSATVASSGESAVKAGSDNSRLIANATPPRVTSVPRRSASEMSANAESELDHKVFGDRKLYAMTLNMPNLNSAGGSWVIHFAELKETEEKGDLIGPVATQEVDPGYPLELMRQNVQGIVTLSAVIHSDGSVSDVRVLRGVDDRLDPYACAALARWRFRPATKNGNPVALQAVVMVPFKPVLKKSGF